MGKPRLPWKRGPAAWKVASRADDVRDRITAWPKSFVSLRQAARLLGVSTQPIRDWIRLGHLKREGPRQQINKCELEWVLVWLCERAEPYPAENYTERLFRKRKRPPDRFETLRRAQFLWPTGRQALTPCELAELSAAIRRWSPRPFTGIHRWPNGSPAAAGKSAAARGRIPSSFQSLPSRDCLCSRANVRFQPRKQRSTWAGGEFEVLAPIAFGGWFKPEHWKPFRECRGSGRFSSREKVWKKCKKSLDNLNPPDFLQYRCNGVATHLQDGFKKNSINHGSFPSPNSQAGCQFFETGKCVCYFCGVTKRNSRVGHDSDAASNTAMLRT